MKDQELMNEMKVVVMKEEMVVWPMMCVKPYI
jgi:hypothetical protein